MLQPRTRGKRFALAFAAAALGVIGLALADPIPKPPRIGGEPIAVTAQPIPSFDKTQTEQKKFGKLKWLGGLALTSPAAAFGGLSGLSLDPDGKKLVAVSDLGAWVTATIDEDGEKPIGLRSVKIGPLLAQSGKPVKRRRDIDAESIRLVEGTLDRGQVYISFERNHRIAVADIGEKGISTAKRFIPLPPDLKLAERNEGIEAIAVMRGGPSKGALVAFAEHFLDARGRHTGWIWVKDKPQAFHLTNPSDFSVTDAASLADGGLLVLERRFNWLEGVRMRLRHLPAADIKPGAVLEGDTLIEASQGQEIDNMEGLAVHETPGGAAVITLVSDDNFNRSLQRTVLLRFAWRRDGLAGAKKTGEAGK